MNASTILVIFYLFALTTLNLHFGMGQVLQVQRMRTSVEPSRDLPQDLSLIINLSSPRPLEGSNPDGRLPRVVVFHENCNVVVIGVGIL